MPIGTPQISKELLHKAADGFMLVAELSHVHQTTSGFASLEKRLLELVADEHDAFRDRVLLGIMYAKRLHVGKCAPLLVEIDEIGERCWHDPELSQIVRLVRATILVVRGERFAEAMHDLAGLYSEMRFGSSGPMFGLLRRWMGLAYMGLAENTDAELAFQDAISVCRRYELSGTYAAALNDYAVLKKRKGEYAEARLMFREVVQAFSAMGATRNLVMALANLGVTLLRTGDWRAAERQLARATALLERATGLSVDTQQQLRWICELNRLHACVMRRCFDSVEDRVAALVTEQEHVTPRAAILSYEFLGELYIETMRYDDAARKLEHARSMAAGVFASSDVMTEILRRRAQLKLETGDLAGARESAGGCIVLALRIADRYELGAAERVLGETYAALGDPKRAAACFGAAVRTLKGIHECYELMRTLYAQGKFLVGQKTLEDGEVSLLEARQLAKKLELDYYQALIAIALMDVLGPQERFDEANTWLTEATSVRDNLEGVDRERVENELKRAAGELQVLMTRASVRSAETLKTICRVYEDARFPIAELKPDLAYQVAQSVGGECLWVVGRHGGGYRVPLTYNIAVNEAKEVVRQLDAGKRKSALLGLDDEPKVLRTANDRTLVAVRCQPVDGSGSGPSGYVLCTRFERIVTITPRQLEILCASADALARLIEDEEERRGRPTGESEEDTIRIKHPRGSFKDILTIDPDMIKVIRTAERAATSVAPILLEGETGVGKELFARAIHEASKRKDFPFVAINAGGLSVHLLESELFGHVKGSFTGAQGDRVGLIESARGGTLFLDEIGEMSEELQVKLLRLLENGEYRRLGESSVRKADVRVISATNRDLKKEVERGSFRRDLFYRVSPIRLTIPPLRLRSRDIQLMVRHFLRDCAALNGIADRYIEIDVKAMEALELYDWPGNVRELYNEILRVVSLIGKGDLVKFAMLSDGIKEYLKTKNRGDGLLDRSVEQYERRLLLNALDRNGWNRMRTADAVGVPRTTLLTKLKRLNVATK